MTNDNLEIRCEELLKLKNDHPLQVGVILEMLAEAGEDLYDEMFQLEYPLLAAA